MPRPDERLDAARRLLDSGDHTLDSLARAVGLSPSHLQRRFAARFGLSPADYAAQQRIKRLKSGLRSGLDATTAIVEAGFGSPSRVYEDGAARLGMTPARYGRGGEGERICWSLIDTVLGRALVAATQRGVCAVELGDDDDALAACLAAEFPRATLQRVDAGRDAFLAPRLAQVADALAGLPVRVDVDLLGTAFQKRVWDALMRIPAGHTCSYAQLADAVGAPRGARAVARACAGNRVAVLVPCHRVVRGDGSLGGYRWGLPIKERVLERERA